MVRSGSEGRRETWRHVLPLFDPSANETLAENRVLEKPARTHGRTPMVKTGVAGMNDKEAIDMMERASAEIKSLRRQIDILAPKAEAYDNMTALIGFLPRRAQGMSEDLAWRLDKRIDELKAASEESSEK
jgi:hypothetical protein